MGDWKEYKLGSEIIEIIDGDRSNNYPKQEELLNIGDVPFLNSSAFKDFKLDYQEIKFLSYEKANSLRKGKVENNDIVLTTRGNGIGKIILFKDKPFKNAILNAQMLIIRVRDPNILPKFLFHLLKSNKMQSEFSNSASGSAQPQLPIFHLKEISIIVPPFEEQLVIERILSSLDDKIDLLHRQNKTLEQLAETLFRQWFVEEAEENWEEKNLDDIADYLNGLALQKFPSKGFDDLSVIKIREMKQGISENTDRCSNDIPQKYIIQDGDILFSWSGSLEVVIWSGGEGALNQHLFKVSSDKYPKWFYYLATQSHLPTFKSIAESKTTTMGHIQREHLKQATISIPPKELFDSFDKTIAPIFEKVIKNNFQIRTLTQLRDTLLPKLMSGEVRVKI